MFPIMIGVFSQASSLPPGVISSTLDNDIVHIFKFLNNLSSTLNNDFIFITNVDNYSSMIRNDNPLAFYELNESSVSEVVRDSMGLYDGIYDDNVLLQQDALIVNSVTKAVRTDTNNHSAFNSGNNLPQLRNFTIEYTLNLSDYENQSKFICGRASYDPTGFPSAFRCYYYSNTDNTTIIYFKIYDETGTNTLIISNSTTILETNIHVIITYDDSIGELKLYINGSLAKTETWIYSISSQSGPIIFGNTYDYGVPTSFPGKIIFDEVAIYYYLLTPTQILQHYTIGFQPSGSLVSTLDHDIVNFTNIAEATEYSLLIQSLNPICYYELTELTTSNPVLDTMGNYEGNYDNDTTMQQSSLISVGNNSILTNGTITSGFNTPSNIPQLADLTVEFWIKPVNTNFAFMMGRAGNTSTNAAFYIYSSGNNCYFRIYAQDDTTYKVSFAPTVIFANNTIYVVGTYNNTTKLMSIFINGTLRDSDTLAGTINEQSGPITYGKGYKDGGLVSPMSATYDEAAIYDYVLSDAQILANYNKGVE